jgi:hypothetical protein
VAQMDDQQRTTLITLRDLFLAGHTPQPGSPPLAPAQMLAEVALLISLPEPQTADGADEQIAALRTASLREYAAAHPSWAYPVMARVQERLPDPETVPDRRRDGAAWSPNAWRSYVALLLQSGDPVPRTGGL